MGDNFSFDRVLQVARFYRFATDKQLIIYLCASVLFSFLILLPSPAYAQVAIFSTTWMTIGFMVQFAPIVLAKHGDSRVVEHLIPARASEKLVFFFIYFFIVVPVVCYLFPEISLWIYESVPSIQTQEMLMLIQVRHSNPPLIVVMNIMNVAAVISTCLYVVLKARNHRVFKGIISVFVANIVLGILGAIYGSVSIFKIGYQAGRSGRDVPPQEAVQEVMNALYSGKAYMIAFIVIVSVYFLSMMYCTYRHLKKSNI